MYTVNNDISNEIIIKNSRFITNIFKITADFNINNYLDKVKKLYPDATHYCYAYITKDSKKYNDDNEPTAGAPMLNVLEKQNLFNVLVVVTRYFGGIKLGVGGLARAYTKSVTECLKKTEIKELVEGYKIKLTISYEDQKYLPKLNIIKEDYQDKITYEVLVSKEEYLNLQKYDTQILEDEYIEK